MSKNSPIFTIREEFDKHKLDKWRKKYVPYRWQNQELDLNSIVKPRKYSIHSEKNHVLVILDPDVEARFFLYKTPITNIFSIPKPVLKILFIENYIDKSLILKRYNNWVEEETYIIFEYRDFRGLLKEYIEMPVRKRGNEHYHKYTWSRIQWYMMVFNSLKLTHELTEYSKKDREKTRKTLLANCLMITLTLPTKFNNGYYWKNISKWFNSWITSLKAKLKRRDNRILFYIKALESQKNGNPHIHIMMKLENPIECYRIPTRRGTYSRPFNKELFNWYHGYYDVRAVDSNKKAGYIMKYITKASNTNRSLKETQTLALSWITNKRLYSTSMFDLYKDKFPNLHRATKLSKRCTVNYLVDDYWNGFEFPKIPWELIPTHKMLGYKKRFILDLNSKTPIRLPIESRLNYEGFYQVTAMRCKNNSNTVVVGLDIPTRPKNHYESDLKRKIRRKRYKKYIEFNKLNK